VLRLSVNLLTSATVPAGTAGTLVNDFRFAAISPIVLGSGSYTIGGFGLGTSLDDFRFAVPDYTAIPGLTIGPAVASAFGNPSLTYPTQVVGFANPGYFGPNFEGAPVPEPGSWILLVTILGAVGVLRRRFTD
jgi:hypothetical protein